MITAKSSSLVLAKASLRDVDCIIVSPSELHSCIIRNNPAVFPFLVSAIAMFPAAFRVGSFIRLVPAIIKGRSAFKSSEAISEASSLNECSEREPLLMCWVIAYPNAAISVGVR
ncbi:hypothetical protein D3C78_1082190 [compost metagenome]